MKICLITTICTIASAMMAAAQVPSLINYQGRLTDASGAPVTGSKNFSISLYDAATAGNLLYTESIGAVTLDANGVYSFQFGGTGTSNSQVTETLATTAAATLVYTKAIANTGIVENSITVTDGTNTWNQSAGNPGVGATATANTISGFVIGATITNGGSDYTSPPAVTISGNGSGAAATAVLTEGVVTGITINSAGSGYTGTPTITIAPPVIPFRVDYNSGTITATYSAAPTAGRTVTASYSYGTNGITGALAKGAEHWMAVSVDGVIQGTRQRVLAVPFAVNAQRAGIADSVMDGSVTAEKLSKTAITDAMSRAGNAIITNTRTTELTRDGFDEILTIDTSSVETSSSYNYIGSSQVWTGSEIITWGGTASNITNRGSSYNPSTNTWRDTNYINAPSGRYGHSAIWTGSEMIIYGGKKTNNFIWVENSGAKYNPETNNWIPISSGPERISHSAIFTGSTMIIWGGQDSNRFLNTGSIYNIADDSWFNIETNGSPSYRNGHTAIWTGTEMIIWGGTGNENLNTGAKYNPTTNTWSPVTNQGAPPPMSGHSAAWTGSEMIIWGPGDLQAGGRYNPIKDEWTPMSTMNSVQGYGAWIGTSFAVWNRAKSYGATYTPSTDTWEKFLMNSTKYEDITGVSIGPIFTGHHIALFSSHTGRFSLIQPSHAFLHTKN